MPAQLAEADVLGVLVPRISVTEYLGRARRTSCGVMLGPDVITQEWRWPDDPGGPRCEACLHRHRLTGVLPTGSPGGEPIGARGRSVARLLRARRRPLNQPSL